MAASVSSHKEIVLTFIKNEKKTSYGALSRSLGIPVWTLLFPVTTRSSIFIEADTPVILLKTSRVLEVQKSSLVMSQLQHELDFNSAVCSDGLSILQGKFSVSSSPLRSGETNADIITDRCAVQMSMGIIGMTGRFSLSVRSAPVDYTAYVGLGSSTKQVIKNKFPIDSYTLYAKNIDIGQTLRIERPVSVANTSVSQNSGFDSKKEIKECPFRKRTRVINEMFSKIQNSFKDRLSFDKKTTVDALSHFIDSLKSEPLSNSESFRNLAFITISGIRWKQISQNCIYSKVNWGYQREYVRKKLFVMLDSVLLNQEISITSLMNAQSKHVMDETDFWNGITNAIQPQRINLFLERFSEYRCAGYETWLVLHMPELHGASEMLIHGKLTAVAELLRVTGLISSENCEADAEKHRFGIIVSVQSVAALNFINEEGGVNCVAVSLWKSFIEKLNNNIPISSHEIIFVGSSKLEASLNNMRDVLFFNELCNVVKQDRNILPRRFDSDEWLEQKYESLVK